MTTTAADKAPRAFCEALVPYLQRVMQLTEYNTTQRPIKDRQFSHNTHGIGVHELEDALEQGARTALCKFVVNDPEAARPILEQLAADDHETAQWLLYEALQAAGETYAAWAAALLLDGDHLLFVSSSSGMVEVAARLLAAITPHIASEAFAALEQAILHLRAMPRSLS